LDLDLDRNLLCHGLAQIYLELGLGVLCCLTWIRIACVELPTLCFGWRLVGDGAISSVNVRLRFRQMKPLIICEWEGTIDRLILE